MAISWKTFDFFDASEVRLSDDRTRSFVDNNEISSVCSGSDSLFFGTHDGYVQIISSEWRIVRSFRAFATGSITHMIQVDGTSLLATVAEDLRSPPILKVWSLDKWNKKQDVPSCLATLTIQDGNKQFPISAFSALGDLTQIAFGFANGAVTLVRGDLIHDLGAKQRIIYESDEPITGLKLRAGAKNTALFIATTSRILLLDITRKGQALSPKTVEDTGCGVGCMTIDDQSGSIVVARDDAIYFYNEDGRGLARAYETPKSLISTHHGYLALVCPPGIESESRRNEAPDRRFGGPTNELLETSTFIILEPDLRIVAHMESMVSHVKFLFQLWDTLFSLTQDGKIYRYREKPVQQRVDMLCQRNMFPLALDLARKSGLKSKQQSDIYRKFGDHLYYKSDYDGAMEQYIKAIDTTEPSQIIRKFLDTQRIHNLIQYLEQLHEKRMATAVHTTLLLNCYAKLKDVKKLESFIKSPGDLKFDLDTAILMCRQGGYFDQAVSLAKIHGEASLVIDILIEDSKKYDEALDFICHQDADTVYSCLSKHARVLIAKCPAATTKLFVDYYTGRYQPREDPVPTGSAVITSDGSNGGALNAMQSLGNLISLPYINSASIPQSSPGIGSRSHHEASPAPTSAEPTPSTPSYSHPPPRNAFSSFVGHPDEFILFLESCLEDSGISELDRSELKTTLFEMCLHKLIEAKDEDRDKWKQKSMALIAEEEANMESSAVLLLSYLSGFNEGTVLVREQSGLALDIFRSYTSTGDTRGALKALRKYGSSHPQLYLAALAYLTSDPKILDEAGSSELQEVLTKIDKDGLMTPLQVVQTLVDQSRSQGFATMGMIKPYLHETIERERNEIATNRRRMAAFRSETDEKRSELADLKTKPAVFQATRCSDCGHTLDLPAVHFLCKHSFHQRCLKGGGTGPDSECPLCAKDNATIRALQKSQLENAGKHELFKDELNHGSSTFETVAKWFGRGVIGISGSGNA